ncbi:4'-phosphopantetheinyl transferase superfamily protein [Balneolaceae bacterium ANBcel3]|nr:4'-phosphopantetheinyl transferase superfamily protein [Balneolaceae bacterium ANBcel3]
MAMVQDEKEEAPESGYKAGTRRVLDRMLIRQGYNTADFSLKKHPSGKPYGLINDKKKVGVSISHCNTLLVCALHTRGETGVDVECCDRALHPGLKERMYHPEEKKSFSEDFCGIRLWTMKEAVLKYKGTGLRLAMKMIRLNRVNPHLFETKVDGEHIYIVSFLFENHWIAIAFSGKEFTPSLLA